MRFRKAYAALALSGILLATPGCKDFFDVNTDPIHPTSATLQQLLPVSQLAMSTYLGFNIQGLGQPASALMGQLTNARDIGAYQQGSDSFTNAWSGLYSDALENNEQIIRQATAAENWGYLGVAQLQKAYIFSQMVDVYGDIPYSQALQGSANLYPRFDRDEDIYNGNDALGIQGLFSLIDEGIANINKPGAALLGGAQADIVYNGNLTNWENFGRTLKLKLYNQIRKTRDVSSEVQALLGQDLMTPNGNFQVRYGSSTSPENRHIGYQSDYVNVGRENNVGPQLFQLMRTGSSVFTATAAAGVADPRIPYYFFNQAPLSITTILSSAYDYQAPSSTRFISTRLGSTGTAAGVTTSADRTLPGLYPYGGRYDNGRGGSVTGDSAQGNGTQRLLPYFSRKFIEAELQLMVLNNPAAAEQAYREGVEAAFTEVNAVRALSAPGAPVLGPAPASILGKFAAAASQEAKLNVIMEQKYIASFGMGVDIYTDFRRTHYPVVRVPGQAQENSAYGLLEDGENNTNGTGGVFPRRFYYPQTDLFANLNETAPKFNQVPDYNNPDYFIFWDR